MNFPTLWTPELGKNNSCHDLGCKSSKNYKKKSKRCSHRLPFLQGCTTASLRHFFTKNFNEFTLAIEMRNIVRIATTKVFLILPQGNPKHLAEPFLSKRSGFSGTIMISQCSESFQLRTLFNSEPLKKNIFKVAFWPGIFFANLLGLKEWKLDRVAPLVADPPQCHWTNRQNQLIYHLYRGKFQTNRTIKKNRKLIWVELSWVVTLSASRFYHLGRLGRYSPTQ